MGFWGSLKGTACCKGHHRPRFWGQNWACDAVNAVATREALGWHWLSRHQTKVFPLKWAGPGVWLLGIVSGIWLQHSSRLINLEGSLEAASSLHWWLHLGPPRMGC